jgi:phosphonate transport system ATP-binding protein
MALLEIKKLTKVYNKETVALKDISLNVQEGEFVSIIGPSGAGKSTLLRCINKMIDATEGEIIFDNIEIEHLKKIELRKARRKIGMIFQHYNLVNRLSVIENVLHGRLGYKSTLAGIAGIYTESEKKRAFEIIDELGLTEQVYKRCDQLSGGQKQRVGISRALIQMPKLMLCDEPIASLDPNSSKVIMDHLRKISVQKGITCIVNLHQVDVAMKYATRIIGLKDGVVVYDGEPNLSRETLYDIYGSEAEDLLISIDEEEFDCVPVSAIV